MVHVITKAPTRIDLAGGTLDLWPIHHNLRQPCTVNVAVSCFALVEIKTRTDKKFIIHSIDQNLHEEHAQLESMLMNSKLTLIAALIKNIWSQTLPGLEIKIEAKSPKGAGLGGSSTLGVCLTSSLLFVKNQLGVADGENLPMTAKSIVELVRNVESRIIRSPAGVQDHWAAVRGGINILSYPDTGVQVETLTTDMIEILNRRMILVYTGASRDSAMNNWIIYRNFFNGDQATITNMQTIADLASDCAQALRKGDLDLALKASEKEWQVRKNLWPTIVTGESEKIDQSARAAGAVFSRFCGAGGGGVMAVFFPEAKRTSVMDACRRAGGSLLEAEISNQGASSESLSS